jgi:predicted  nucleic acid-binding Zn-ribbon protein
MSEETTQEQNGARPFEERVLSALAEMRADFNTRLERLEAKQYDTKPIWQQALTEIMEVNKRLEDFDVRFDRMESDVAKTRSEMLSLRADFKEFRAHFKEPA